MVEYLHQKTRLFTEFTKQGGVVILNSEDEHSKQIADRVHNKVIFYGKNNGVIQSYQQTNDGFELQIANKVVNFFVHGVFQIANLACSINALLALNFKIDDIVKCIPKLRAPFGRMEGIQVCGINVIVDYAHTPDALLNILQSVSGYKILVFGCGGNRDKTKRPIMGKIAADYADYVIITSDNPRNERPEDIIDDILTGIVNKSCDVILDRAEAIRTAINIAKQGQYVIIAGKGSEDYQEINGVKMPFKDLDVVKNYASSLESINAKNKGDGSSK
jgi:UDP-N-acetylmuramoyl-L-alanyl-D-glutamate--2,6-diaminopimelate ligase